MLDVKIIASNVEEFIVPLELSPEEEISPDEKMTRSVGKAAVIVANLEWSSIRSLVTVMRIFMVYYTSDWLDTPILPKEPDVKKLGRITEKQVSLSLGDFEGIDYDQSQLGRIIGYDQDSKPQLHPALDPFQKKNDLNLTRLYFVVVFPKGSNYLLGVEVEKITQTPDRGSINTFYSAIISNPFAGLLPDSNSL